MELSDSDNSYTRIGKTADGRSLSPTKSDKDLSEDERFTLDYGDIGSNDELDTDEYAFSEYNYLDRSQDQNREDTRQINTEVDERTSLLGENQSANTVYSGNQESSTPAATTLPRGRLKRGDSNAGLP